MNIKNNAAANCQFFDYFPTHVSVGDILLHVLNIANVLQQMDDEGKD